MVIKPVLFATLSISTSVLGFLGGVGIYEKSTSSDVIMYPTCSAAKAASLMDDPLPLPTGCAPGVSDACVTICIPVTKRNFVQADCGRFAGLAKWAENCGHV